MPKRPSISERRFTFTVRMPERLLAAIHRSVETRMTTITEFVRQALIAAVQRDSENGRPRRASNKQSELSRNSAP